MLEFVRIWMRWLMTMPCLYLSWIHIWLQLTSVAAMQPIPIEHDPFLSILLECISTLPGHSFHCP